LFTVEQPDEMYCVVTNPDFLDSLKDNIGDYDVLILDTIGDYHEGNTYESELVNKSMSAIRRFVKKTNVGVILITHTRKGSKVKIDYDVEDIADSRVFTSKSDFVFGIKSEYQNDGTNLIEIQYLKGRAPEAFPRIRAEIFYSKINGSVIQRTTRPFRSELDASNKQSQIQTRFIEVKRLKESGKTVRDIAKAIGVSNGTVQKIVNEIRTTDTPAEQE